MVRPSSSIRQVGRFSFSPVPLIAATPFTVAVEDRRAHAEHAVGVLLVIDRVTAGRVQLQVSQQGLGIGHGAFGPGRHARLQGQRAGLFGRQGGEQRLADRRAVRVLPLAQVAGEPDGARRVDPRGDHGVRAVGHLPGSRSGACRVLGRVGHKPHLLGVVCHKPRSRVSPGWGTWATSPIYRGLCATSPIRPGAWGGVREAGIGRSLGWSS
jgi:hypothetical protein